MPTILSLIHILNEDATKWEPVITWTEADNEKYHASYPAQEGLSLIHIYSTWM